MRKPNHWRSWGPPSLKLRTGKEEEEWEREKYKSQPLQQLWEEEYNNDCVAFHWIIGTYSSPLESPTVFPIIYQDMIFYRCNEGKCGCFGECDPAGVEGLRED